MATKPKIKRKTISLDADVALNLEREAARDGRTVSNLVNFRLRSAMNKRGTTIRKGERV